MAEDQRPVVASLFDAIADVYDAIGVDFVRPIAAGLCTELAPRPGERVVDIGCGRGALLFPLAEAVGPDGSVIGLDLSPRMVELTAADVTAAGLADRVTVRVGDAMAPDVEGGVDVVAASLVLFFLPDPLEAVRRWRDLLVDGGRVGVSTFGPFSPEWRAVNDVFRPYLPPEMADPGTREAGPFESDETMEALFADAGLGRIRTVTQIVEVRFDDVDHWYRWSMSQGQRRMWASVPEDQQADVRARAGAIVAGTRRPDGSLGFDQHVRHTLGRR